MNRPARYGLKSRPIEVETLDQEIADTQEDWHDLPHVRDRPRPRLWEELSNLDDDF